MQQIALPNGRLTSRIGFGCGRLVGGSGRAASLRIIEAARSLGINHFDIAPSYGLGLAEDVLGEALCGDDGTTIATKAGIGRPPAAKLLAAPVKTLRPMVRKLPWLKAALLRHVPQSPRGKFTPVDVEASVDESIRRLRRSQVDALLLHQPEPEAVSDELSTTVEKMIRAGLIGAAGSGTEGCASDVVPFGTIAQHRWTLGAEPTACFELVHGVLRSMIGFEWPTELSDEVVSLGFDPAAPTGLLLTLALAERRNRIVLISSHHPKRLQDAVLSIDWSRADGSDVAFVARGQALLRESRRFIL